jgi:predicted outer membrane repeat protein
MTRFISIALTMLMSATLHGADIKVPQDAASIGLAISRAKAGDRIVVSPGRWIGGIDFGGKSITIESTHGAKRTVIDAMGMGPAVRLVSGEGPKTVLRGFRVTGGVGDPTLYDGNSRVGGGIVILGGAARIEQCTIDGNHADYRGGGLYAARSAFQLLNCTVTDNGSEKGGGVYLYGGTPVLRGGTIGFNEARYGGGGVFIDRSTVVLSDIFFDENKARFSGGAVSVLDARPAITGCRFLNNKAGVGGGAVHLGWGATLRQLDNEFVQQGDDIRGGNSGRLRVAKGACCFGDLCIEVLEQACVEAGGRWEGPETDCVGILAARCQAVRPGDLDRNETVDIRDLGRLLMIWGDLEIERR